MVAQLRAALAWLVLHSRFFLAPLRWLPRSRGLCRLLQASPRRPSPPSPRRPRRPRPSTPTRPLPAATGLHAPRGALARRCRRRVAEGALGLVGGRGRGGGGSRGGPAMGMGHLVGVCWARSPHRPLQQPGDGRERRERRLWPRAAAMGGLGLRRVAAVVVGAGHTLLRRAKGSLAPRAALCGLGSPACCLRRRGSANRCTGAAVGGPGGLLVAASGECGARARREVAQPGRGVGARVAGGRHGEMRCL